MKGYFRVRHKQCLSLLYAALLPSPYAPNIGTCIVRKGIASLLGCGTWCDSKAMMTVYIPDPEHDWSAALSGGGVPGMLQVNNNYS